MAALEERETAIFCGYKWKEWLRLERGERAAGIAHYRMHHIIEMHGEDAIAQETERRAKTRH